MNEITIPSEKHTHAHKHIRAPRCHFYISHCFRPNRLKQIYIIVLPTPLPFPSSQTMVISYVKINLYFLHNCGKYFILFFMVDASAKYILKKRRFRVVYKSSSELFVCALLWFIRGDKCFKLLSVFNQLTMIDDR